MLLRRPTLFPFVWEMETKSGREQWIRNDVGIAAGEAFPRIFLSHPFVNSGLTTVPLALQDVTLGLVIALAHILRRDQGCRLKDNVDMRPMGKNQKDLLSL